MREVYLAKNRFDAYAMSDLLKARGIPALIQGDPPTIVTDVGFPSVWVREEDFHRARALVEEFERAAKKFK